MNLDFMIEKPKITFKKLDRGESDNEARRPVVFVSYKESLIDFEKEREAHDLLRRKLGNRKRIDQ